MLPGRSRWGAIRGGREPQGRRPISAPSGRPLRPGRSTANGIGASSRTGIGSGAEGAFRLNAGAPADVAACEIVAPRAPPRPRMGHCDDEARLGRRTCSAAAADGPVAGGPAAQKGGWRVSFTPRPAPLPVRSGVMTPFPMSAGAAAHPKVTRRPPFSPRRRPGPRRWGPPEVFTHPGRHRHRPVHDGGRCRSDVPREAARRTEGLIPVRAGPVVRDAAPEVGGGGAPREPRRGAAWSASTSLNPRARTSSRRSRGLPDDLAGYVTCSRPGRRPRCGPAELLPRRPPVRRRRRGARRDPARGIRHIARRRGRVGRPPEPLLAGPGRAESAVRTATNPRSGALAPTFRPGRGRGDVGWGGAGRAGTDPDPACVMRAQRNTIRPASRRASPARRNPPALDSR